MELIIFYNIYVYFSNSNVLLKAFIPQEFVTLVLF